MPRSTAPAPLQFSLTTKQNLTRGRDAASLAGLGAASSLGHENVNIFATLIPSCPNPEDSSSPHVVARQNPEPWFRILPGGEGGIRTLGTREGTTVFKTVAFDRSATSPRYIGVSPDL